MSLVTKHYHHKKATTLRITTVSPRYIVYADLFSFSLSFQNCMWNKHITLYDLQCKQCLVFREAMSFPLVSYLLAELTIFKACILLHKEPLFMQCNASFSTLSAIHPFIVIVMDILMITMKKIFLNDSIESMHNLSNETIQYIISLSLLCYNGRE